MIFTLYIVKLSLSLYILISKSLNLSLSLTDSDRADTIITFHPSIHQKLFKNYIIGIVNSSPTHFHFKKIGLIRVTNYLSFQN